MLLCLTQQGFFVQLVTKNVKNPPELQSFPLKK